MNKEAQKRIATCRAEKSPILDLRNLALEQLPPAFGELVWLQVLYLSNTSITDISVLGSLTKLEGLYLSNTSITDISVLGSLTKLQRLSLDNTSITDISVLGSLTKLQGLNLSNNPIDKIEQLENLNQLQLLDLSNTLIEDLEFTEEMPNLNTLPLFWKNSAVIDYYFSIVRNPGIYLYGCDQLVQPSPAWVQLGKAAVQDYFRAITEQGAETLREAKLMLVGPANMGKTTLSGKLLDKGSAMPPSTGSTKGIVVTPWKYDYKGKDYTLNIWDFGGQDLQYSLHQFFMTERAIYCLLSSTREQYDQSPGSQLLGNYWLHAIQKLAAGSTTFHVYNHYEKHIRNTRMHDLLRPQYPFLEAMPIVVNLERVDKEEEERQQLEILRTKIKNAVAALPNVGLVLPRQWAAIRQVLMVTSQTEVTITLQRYRAICQEQGIDNKEIMLLISSYLHEIGSIVHYNQDKTSPLYKLLILQRRWATEAVYAIATSPMIEQQEGIFERQQLETVLQASHLTSQEVESYLDHLSELHELLRKFEVCYPLGDNRFLIPQLLPPHCKQPNTVLPADLDGTGVQLEYNYEFMPYGLIHRLAVRLHLHIEDGQIWYGGMILTHNVHGLVGYIQLQERREQYRGAIQLLVYGDKAARYFLQQQIDKELTDLHRIYNISEQVRLLVPCVCKSCSSGKTQKKYAYQKLVEKLKRNNKKTIECDESIYDEDVKLLALIDHAFWKRPEEVQAIVEHQNKKHFGDMYFNINNNNYSKKNFIEGNVEDSNINIGDG